MFERDKIMNRLASSTSRGTEAHFVTSQPVKTTLKSSNRMANLITFETDVFKGQTAAWTDLVCGDNLAVSIALRLSDYSKNNPF